MALGKKLREAREKMNLTPSQVAAATRMKVQMVEAIEREDFSRIAAPIYGKGFIRLYAEHVGLDAKPLVDEYTRLMASPAPSLAGAEARPPLRSKAEEAAANAVVDSEFHVIEAAGGKGKDDAAEATGAKALRTAGGGGTEAAMDLFTRALPDEPRVATPPAASADELTAERVRPEAGPGRDAVWSKGLMAVRETWRTAQASWAQRTGSPSTEDARRSALRTITVIVGIAVIIIFVVSVLSKCVHRSDRESLPRVHGPADSLRVVGQLPEPYVK